MPDEPDFHARRFDELSSEITYDLVLGLTLNRAPLIVWAVDKQGIFRFSAGKGLESLGTAPDSRNGQSVFSIYQDHPDILDHHRRALSGQETRGVIQTGDKYFDLSLTPMKNRRQEVTGAFGVAHDLTRLQRTTNDLRERNRMLEAVYAVDRATAESLALSEVLAKGLDAKIGTFSAVGGAIHLVEEADRALVLHVSQGLPSRLANQIALLPIGGSVVGEAVSSGEVTILKTSDDASDALLEEARCAGFATIAVAPLICQGETLGAITILSRGHRRYSRPEQDLLQSIGIQLGGAVHRARLYEAVLRDEHTLEQEVALRTRQLEERARELEEANRAKSTILSTVAHDLNNRITLVAGYAHLLRSRKAPLLDDQGTQWLNRIVEGEESLASMARDLLDISRSQLNTLQLNRKQFDLIDMVGSVIEEMRIVTDEKHQHLTFTSEGHPHWIEADESRLRRVVVNLLTNASKYSPEGMSIDCMVRFENRNALIQVTDRGIGITKDEQAKLFEPFFRSERKVVQLIAGTGLGLSICKGIIESHGGQIEVTSRLGQGSSFAVRLPLDHRSA